MLVYTIAAWCTQRVCSLGLVSLISLLYLALWHSRQLRPGEINNSQLVLACYTILIHILGLAFPLRLCYATWRLTKRLKESNSSRKFGKQLPVIYTDRPKEISRVPSFSEVSSYASSSSDITTSDSESSASSFEDEQSVLHVIIIPNYKEELDTLRETLEVLACHPQARSTYEICLAMEQGEEGSDMKASILMIEFEKYFRVIDCTIHPRNIVGEAQGKSSNLCWAARKFLNRNNEKMETQVDVILTVIDADSHLSNKYFSSITGLHFAHPSTSSSTIYVPPIVFDRNSHLVPILVRMADLLWSGAGMSGHYETSTICPPTSVYSLPLTLVEKVGGWDADEGAIGEDLHMYIKCFFGLQGNLTTRTVLSAASQTNVHSNGRGIRGLYTDINARYRQALRHMWGALDSGYVIKSTMEMFWKNVTGGCDHRPNYPRTIILLHRMFEAHFLPTHITLILLTTTLYNLLTPSTQVPILLRQSLLISDRLRLCSLITFATFFFLYERFHQTCIDSREQEMITAGLAGKMEGSFSHRKSWRKNVLDYATFPIAGIIFGSFPSVIAQFSHFWTLSLVYRVSKKPERKGVAMT